MKTQDLFLLTATISCILISCSKDKDETGPSITMLGKNPDTLIVKTVSSYDDPGATATDDKDGDVTSKIVVASNVDVNKPGHYLIYYSVEDNSHNMSSKLTRVVEVVKADGNYLINESCNSGGAQNYSGSINTNTSYDTISIVNFPVSGVTVKAKVKEGGYNIFYQSLNLALDLEGDISVTGTQLTANYIKHINSGPGSTDTCSATLIKQ